MARPANIGDQVKALIEGGVTFRSIAANLGISIGTVSYHAAKLGRTRWKRDKWSWSEVQTYYDAGHPPTKCRAHFGIPQGTFASAVKEGRLRVRDPHRKIRMSADQYAAKYNGVRGSSVRQRLKKKILAEGSLDYACAVCGIDQWRGEAISLRLDHVDGDGRNHSAGNLRFICPNCDSQQPTHGYKNRGRYS